MDWIKERDASIDKRLKLFQEQEIALKKEIKKLQKSLSLIQYKKWYYTKVIQDKTEEFVKNLKPEEMPKDIQNIYQKYQK